MDQYLSWIAEGYTSDLNGESMPGMPAFWEKAPSGGALANSGEDQGRLAANHIDRILSQARLTHLSWLGPNIPATAETVSRINAEKLRNTMGYRFAIRTESHMLFERPNRMVVGKLILENSGSAPFYFGWPAELSLLDEGGHVIKSILLLKDVGVVLPGEMTIRFLMMLPEDIGTGRFRLGFAILDPDTGAPGIQMPMLEKTKEGWYLLGEIILP